MQLRRWTVWMVSGQQWQLWLGRAQWDGPHHRDRQAHLKQKPKRNIINEYTVHGFTFFNKGFFSHTHCITHTPSPFCWCPGSSLAVDMWSPSLRGAFGRLISFTQMPASSDQCLSFYYKIYGPNTGEDETEWKAVESEIKIMKFLSVSVT